MLELSRCQSVICRSSTGKRTVRSLSGRGRCALCFPAISVLFCFLLPVIDRVEGTTLSDALVVLAAVAADDFMLLHLHTEVLFGKIHGAEDGEVRIPLAAARSSNLADGTELIHYFRKSYVLKLCYCCSYAALKLFFLI